VHKRANLKCAKDRKLGLADVQRVS
jgi:hypothetical protein